MDTESNWRCHLCHSPRRRVLARLAGKDGRPYWAVRCAECGLLCADPMPEMSLLQFQQVYSENYYQTGWRDRGEGYLDPAKVASMEQEARDQRLEIERRTGLSTGAILDIGCGDGRYLKEFQQAGWKVAGVEISEYIARLAEKRLGIQIYSNPLESLDLEPEQFDLVRLKHCIEHLADPRTVLQKVAQLLRPGGYAVIDTDNAGGLRSRAENSIRRLLGRTLSRSIVKCLTGKDLDTKYGRLSPPIHLYSFDLSTLTRLLDEVGLQVLYSLRPAQGHPVWFPQLGRYRCNPLEVLFRLVDDLGGRFDRGEVLVVFARKPMAQG